jgi:hypothetical protein
MSVSEKREVVAAFIKQVRKYCFMCGKIGFLIDGL